MIDRMLLIFSQLCYALAISIAVGGCTKERVVVQKEPVEVRVPVSVACLGPMPAEVTPLKDQITEQEWKTLPTDTRTGRIGEQGLERKVYGEEVTAAASGCPSATPGSGKSERPSED